MGFEKSYTPEKRKGREYLLSLEKAGKYVFHGSPDDIDVLEPRQAYGENEENGDYEKDGESAVFATRFADVAIFRSLINERLGGDGSECGMSIDNDNNIYYRSSRDLLEKVKDHKGKVYVLKSEGFSDFKGLDCRSNEQVVPIEIVEVDCTDLPKNIDIIESR
ncbi:MAG: hypothetical protein WC819_02950 [Parcubacteria group bacterium]|jgi:hypothetical protein